MILKQCKRCRVYKLKGQVDSEGICSDCRKREIKQEKPEPTPVEQPTKACARCGLVLSLDRFGDDRRTKDGKRKVCLDCEAQQ